MIQEILKFLMPSLYSKWMKSGSLGVGPRIQNFFFFFFFFLVFKCLPATYGGFQAYATATAPLKPTPQLMAILD